MYYPRIHEIPKQGTDNLGRCGGSHSPSPQNWNIYVPWNAISCILRAFVTNIFLSFRWQILVKKKNKQTKKRETCARCSTSKPPLPPDATSLAGLTTTRLLGEVVQPYAKNLIPIYHWSTHTNKFIWDLSLRIIKSAKIRQKKLNLANILITRIGSSLPRQG